MSSATSISILYFNFAVPPVSCISLAQIFCITHIRRDFWKVLCCKTGVPHRVNPYRFRVPRRQDYMFLCVEVNEPFAPSKDFMRKRNAKLSKTCNFQAVAGTFGRFRSCETSETEVKCNCSMLPRTCCGFPKYQTGKIVATCKMFTVLGPLYKPRTVVCAKLC